MTKLAWVLVLVALLGCDKGQTERQRDCAKARELFEPGPARRYRPGGDPDSKAAKLALRDAEVRSAVHEILIDQELLLLDEPDRRSDAYGRLTKLCNLKPRK
jgi:hypothetical protein